ncbi:MAG: AMP-binding protein, partial [Pseudomonadota bacterium]
PMTGAVLLTLNTRLDADTLRYCLEHAEAKIVIVDCELSETLAAALQGSDLNPFVVRVDDVLARPGGPADVEYEAFLADAPASRKMPEDEWDSFSLSYTSGTTGRPKGVVYSHRGVATTAISNALDWALPHFPVYLWTLPMFHCNGWCFPYTVAMTAGTNVCLRAVTPDAIVAAFKDHGVTHFCGAPIIMQMAIDGANKTGFTASRPIKMMTAAAPPPAAVIARLEAIGIDVTHVYGLTETYGPCVVSAWKPEWDGANTEERARLKARQGVPYTLQATLSVRHPETMDAVADTGEDIGEIMIGGNIVMKG